MADLFTESETTSCTDLATNSNDWIDDRSGKYSCTIFIKHFYLYQTSIPNAIEILVTLALMLSIDVE